MFRRVSLSSEWLGHERRRWDVISTSFLQQQSGLRVSWKLCLNMCLRRWLSSSRSLASSFTPIGLWQSKELFQVGLMNFKIFDIKVLSASELQLFESNLLNSIMVDWKYEFSKSECCTFILGIFCAFLVLYWQLDCGIVLWRYLGEWFLYILKKKQFSKPTSLLKGLRTKTLDNIFPSMFLKQCSW